MTTQYYIYQDANTRQGPFDIVSMIKKIRNGSVTPHTLVLDSNEEEPAAAGSIEALATFFNSGSDTAEHHHGALEQLTLNRAIKNGIRFLQNHQISAVYTGVLMLFTIAVTILTWKLGVIGHIVAFILSYTALGGYMLCILRLTRGQTIEKEFIVHRLKLLALPLFIASAIISLLSVIGMLLVVIPGLFVLTFYMFSPLLILDRGMDFWDAMESSRRTVMKGGIDMVGVIFALVVINFVGAALGILPLLVTLPVTIGALSEIYDEFFYR